LNITPAAAEMWDLKDGILKVKHITILHNTVRDTLLLNKSHTDIQNKERDFHPLFVFTSESIT
jgi:hypothetical protein